jgi:hypothetical protein
MTELRDKRMFIFFSLRTFLKIHFIMWSTAGLGDHWSRVPHMTYFKFRINMNLKGVGCNAVISLIWAGGGGGSEIL